MEGVIISKKIKGFELSENLAKSAEKLISAVVKSERGIRELSRELYNIKENRLLDGTEFKGIGEFFESITGLSASSASQYIKTYKAFKEYDNNVWSSYSALLPFSMLTEISKLYGTTPHYEIINGNNCECLDTSACGNELLTVFGQMLLDCYDDISIDGDPIGNALEYCSKNLTNKIVRELIENSDLIGDLEEAKGKKKEKKEKNTEDNTEDYKELKAIADIILEYANSKKMSKKQFIESVKPLISEYLIIGESED